jgi:peptidoglycan/LPS O-acetylase OafA/YrhL
MELRVTATQLPASATLPEEKRTQSHRPAPSPSRREHYYRPELDVVRFLAFLLVFLFHDRLSIADPRLALLPRSFLARFGMIETSSSFGVSLFFCLSAFLIFELLLRERRISGTVSVKQFYIRRILRLWPLFYAGIALGVLSALIPAPNVPELHAIVWFAVFLGGWWCTLYNAPGGAFDPLWSISVEEQFYLVAPWVAKYCSRPLIAAFCALLLAVSNGCLFYLGATGAASHWMWFNSAVQFQCFAVGILLCLALRGQVPHTALWLRAVMVIAAFAGWYIAILLSTVENAGTGFARGVGWTASYDLISLGCVLLLLGFLGIDAKFLPRWAVALGRISYGLYVFHMFVLRIFYPFHLGHRLTLAIPFRVLRLCLSESIDVALPLLATCLVAALSYRFFETPFLRLKKRHSIIASQPILGEK